MTKNIKRPTKPLSKKLREPIALEPIPTPPAIETAVLFPNLLKDYEKKSLSVALKNADHQAFESLEKLCLLCEQYGLHKDDPDRWFFLAFYLARDHVFKIQTKANAGRKKGWNDKLLLQLYIDVEEKLSELKKQKRRILLKTIFHDLAKENQWKAIIGNSKDASGVLHDNYNKAKKVPFVIFFNGLRNAIDKADHEERIAIFKSLDSISKIFPQNCR